MVARTGCGQQAQRAVRDFLAFTLGVAVAVLLAALSALFGTDQAHWRIAGWIAGAAVVVFFPLWVRQIIVDRGASKARLYLSGPNLFRDPKYKNANRWTMRVHNRGPAAARRVLMRLQGAPSAPRTAAWKADYPYPVFPLGTITNDPAQTSNPQRQINAQSYQDYEIATGSEMENGKLKTELKTKGGGHNDVPIEPDERWRLDYEVTSENADPLRFTLELFVESNEVKARMIGV
jgi:hypothetical protein